MWRRSIASGKNMGEKKWGNWEMFWLLTDVLIREEKSCEDAEEGYCQELLASGEPVFLLMRTCEDRQRLVVTLLLSKIYEIARTTNSFLTSSCELSLCFVTASSK